MMNGLHRPPAQWSNVSCGLKYLVAPECVKSDKSSVKVIIRIFKKARIGDKLSNGKQLIQAAEKCVLVIITALLNDSPSPAKIVPVTLPEEDKQAT